MRVRIGIPVPTTRDMEYNARSWPEYAEAVRGAGAEAVRLPLSAEVELRQLARSCQGFVLPGSPADVDPSTYGQEREPETADADAARDACDRWLLQHAEETGKPVLAICYGLQLLNVWRGGSLVQDLRPVPVNHGAGAAVAVAHGVAVTAQSLLGGLLTAGEAPAEVAFRKLPVNSSHHQAIGIAGEGLTAVARSTEDGVLEAVEGRLGRAGVLGVQWHPERSLALSAASRALFLWLVASAEDAAGTEE